MIGSWADEHGHQPRKCGADLPVCAIGGSQTEMSVTRCRMHAG